MNGLVSIVTVVFQSHQCLQRLRQSLLEHTRHPYQWVIVDNGSSRSETITELRDIESSGEAIVVWNGENLMFTRGVNAGLAKAGGDPIILLNPDCEVTPGWLEALLSVAAKPGVGIVGPVMVDERGVVVHGGARGDGSHDGFGEKYRPDGCWAQEREHDGWITGACLLITRSALEAVGGKLDERYQHYFSDKKLCEAVRAAGYRIWVCGHVIIHSMGKAYW